MNDFLFIVLLVGAWVFVQAYLLPRLGVPT